MTRDSLSEEDADRESDRHKYPPRGILGGGDGSPTRIEFRDGTRPHQKGRTVMQPGELLGLHFPGGGGYGDPAVSTVPERRTRQHSAQCVGPLPKRKPVECTGRSRRSGTKQMRPAQWRGAKEGNGQRSDWFPRGTKHGEHNRHAELRYRLQVRGSAPNSPNSSRQPNPPRGRPRRTATWDVRPKDEDD